MKLIDNYYRRQITKLKSSLKFKQREVDKLHIDAKNYEAEIQKLHSFYKSEMAAITERESVKWKNVLNEKDIKIQDQQKFIEDNKKLYDFLHERDEAFKEMFTLVNLELTSTSNLHIEANKKLLTAGSKWQYYKDKFLKSDKIIDEKVNE